ncbi:NUDIX hydrolase [Paenibacillus hodogayensis]|uniref:NUDIX hydrolase n=1 Tax=Paenibacillus hodogayensis TaxID=279208 RepID=A0ABV5VT21_9BACL
MNPKLRAAGIMIRDFKAGDPRHGSERQVLVQCDEDESFYRFAGGTVEYGETAAEAIVREFMEEYDLEVKVGPLIAVNEHFFQYYGKEHHQVTLIHHCELAETDDIPEPLWHKEHSSVKLVWRTLSQLKRRPVYPEGIFPMLEQEYPTMVHLVTGRGNR